MKDKIRIGCGAGFSGDRIEPAVVLAEKAQLDYLVLNALQNGLLLLHKKESSLILRKVTIHYWKEE